MTREWEQAVCTGAVDDLERLRVQGADVNAKDRHGQTALMVAACAGDAGVVRWLIAHGADLDHTAKYGLSALMLAVVNRRHAIVRLLVEAGADQRVRGTGAPGFAGKTALELAAATNDEDLTETLRGAELRE